LPNEETQVEIDRNRHLKKGNKKNTFREKEGVDKYNRDLP